ncbi:M48 family metallopeptidase, partial [Bacteroidota bacterium]
KVKTKFGFITSIFSLAIMLIFWFAGGFNWLDDLLRGVIDNSILRGLAYIGSLLLANSIISLPLSIYSTFVIEEKFGFNKTTAKTFILDIFKSLILAVIIGGALLATVLWIFEIMGNNAWLYGWITVTIISIILQFIAPTIIMPLFNKFTPLEDGDLKQAIMDYAKSVKFSLKNIFVIDGSKRSSKSNAFFTGFGKNKRIALFDTLIEKHTIGELVAVLAHEIGHYKKKHIIINMAISIIHTGILFYLLSVFLNEAALYKAFFMNEMSLYTGLIFFGMLYSPIELILSIILNMFSRKNEFEADSFAVESTNKPDDMINALKKLSKDNLSNLTPHPFYVFLNYSHPQVLERIRNIKK